MMAARRLIVIIALATAGLSPVPGVAEEQPEHRVDIFSNEFTPDLSASLSPGVVKWYWLSGSHSVTAYSGASFDSGVRGTNSTFSYQFNGGTVKYRCVLHSTLSATGECSGAMCGYLTDQESIDVTKPRAAINRPNTFYAVGTPTVAPGPRPQNLVTIGGTASDDVAVFGVGLRIYDSLARVTEVQVSDCPLCRVASSVAWQERVHLVPGSYVVEAIAADTSGNTQVSPRVQFIVV